MTNDVNYQALANEGNPFTDKSSHHEIPGPDETTTDTENEDGHRDVMIHVVPDTSKGKSISQLSQSIQKLITIILQRDGITSKI